MNVLKLPVRWYGGAGYYTGKQDGDGHCYDTIELCLERTAFMIVDSDCGEGNCCVENAIAPALVVARQVGMNVLFIHNDFSLVDEPGSIKREIHGTRWGQAAGGDRPAPSRVPVVPNYSPSIQPLEHEPDFPKREWSGFHETHVDYYLRCYDIKNLIAVGFSQRSCLYQTLNGAVEHNYRVVMLRNFEHVVGYTSTSAEFTAACRSQS